MSLKKTLLVTCLLAVSGSAMAATTADLMVTGKIVPAGCNVTIGNGAPLDLGDINVSSLNQDVPTPLVVPSIPFNITCTGPVALSTGWIDNRASNGVYPSSAPTRFSMGKDSADTPIGHLWIQHGSGESVQVTGNGSEVVANVIFSTDGGINWANSTYGQASQNHINSYAPVGEVTPAAYTTYTGTFKLKPQIAPANTLDLSSALTLDASATMEVTYL